MRSGKRVEVDWGDIVEKLALVEDADEVPADETTEAVSGDGEFLDDSSPFLEFLYFLEDLTGSAMGLSDRVVR